MNSLNSENESILRSDQDNRPVGTSVLGLAEVPIGVFSCGNPEGEFTHSALPRLEVDVDRCVSSPGSTGSNDFSLEWSFVEEPESFAARNYTGESSGVFVVTQEYQHREVIETNWELDLSPAAVSGDGINEDIGRGVSIGYRGDPRNEDDFLRVKRQGRPSSKRAAAVTDTRISIPPQTCRTQAAEILERGYWTEDDLDHLIGRCSGNGNESDLRVNLGRTLDCAGLLCMENWDGPKELLSSAAVTDVDELALGLEAVLSRDMVLPGVGRFEVDKRSETALLDAVRNTKLLLQIEVLGSKFAVDEVLFKADDVLEGVLKPAEVTTRLIVGDRDDDEAVGFREAVTRLRSWRKNGAIMEGKERRQALRALEDLDLTFAFLRSLVAVVLEADYSRQAARGFSDLIFNYETATNELIIKHLPFARRYASRNTADDEELEDVFQICTLGLFGAARRFKSHGGARFNVYSMFWMKQVLTRWRGDEGSLVRVPVHRHFKLAELDQAKEDVERRTGCRPNINALAVALGWTPSDVERLAGVPRENVDFAFVQQQQEALFDDTDAENALYFAQRAEIISNELLELPERQAEVLRMRYGLGGQEEMTLEEVGQVFGVTRERIRQVEAKALEYLSHPGRKRRLQAILGL